MKYVVIVGDGMADFPISELNNKTPLEIARTPHFDTIAKIGCGGLARNVPKGMDPASDVANLSILGYDPKECYSGRGPLEAIDMGIELQPNQVAFRCNFVTISDGMMADYSAGHISNEEGTVLIDLLNKELGADSVQFYQGMNYRNIVVIDEAKLEDGSGTLHCVPPHDITGKPINANIPRGKGSEFLIGLMEKAANILGTCEINKVRIDHGENPANMIWLWGYGKTPQMVSFQERFGVRGAVISAVKLLKGIGKALKMDVIDVPGATGYYDTNYKGKAEHCLKALSEGCDYVFVHIEAPDEAGHNGDLTQKVLAIENIDEHVVKVIMEGIAKYDQYRVLLLPDHYTPLSVKTHIPDPVPFVMCGSDINADDMQIMSENEAQKGSCGVVEGHALMDMLIQK